jgi:hypothetical protein
MSEMYNLVNTLKDEFGYEVNVNLLKGLVSVRTGSETGSKILWEDQFDYKDNDFEVFIIGVLKKSLVMANINKALIKTFEMLDVDVTFNEFENSFYDCYEDDFSKAILLALHHSVVNDEDDFNEFDTLLNSTEET